MKCYFIFVALCHHKIQGCHCAVLALIDTIFWPVYHSQCDHHCACQHEHRASCIAASRLHTHNTFKNVFRCAHMMQVCFFSILVNAAPQKPLLSSTKLDIKQIQLRHVTESFSSFCATQHVAAQDAWFSHGADYKQASLLSMASCVSINKQVANLNFSRSFTHDRTEP